MLSATGEKVGESHVTLAARRAASALGVVLAGFSATVRLEGDLPRYVFVVEPRENWTPAQRDPPSSVASTMNCRRPTSSTSRSGGEEPSVLPSSRSCRRARTSAIARQRVAQGASDLQVKPPVLFPSERELRDHLGMEACNERV